EQITRLLPAEYVVSRHPPGRAGVVAAADEKLQKERAVVELPAFFGFVQDGRKKPPRLGASEEMFLVWRFVVAVAGGDHHPFNAQVHHFIEEGADALGIGA